MCFGNVFIFSPEYSNLSFFYRLTAKKPRDKITVKDKLCKELVMDRKLLSESIEKNAVFSFARSGGHGGQNVNKVNTKVHCTLSVNCLEGLSQKELELVKQRLASRINSGDFLSVDVQDERTQEKNRAIALKRLESLVVQAAFIPKARKKTSVPKSAREKRLKTKKLLSMKKRQRNQLYLPD